MMIMVLVATRLIHMIQIAMMLMLIIPILEKQK